MKKFLSSLAVVAAFTLSLSLLVTSQASATTPLGNFAGSVEDCPRHSSGPCDLGGDEGTVSNELKTDNTKGECDVNDAECCRGVDTAIDYGCEEGNPIYGLLIAIINFMAIGVGIAAVGGVVYGGIKFTTARGNSNQVEEAKKIIGNAVLAIVLFALMFAFLNFLIPGGVFN